MMQFSPVPPITNLDGRPINGVEIDVIFTHELVKLDVLGVEPPLLPLRGVAGGDTRISDRRIELGVC
jgi:hypothetical protein